MRGKRRPHATHVRVGLAIGEAGEAVELRAAHTASGLGIGLVEVDAHRQVERMVPSGEEVLVELLDARLVRHRRMGERSRAIGLGRVLARLAVHQVDALGLGVVRLEIRIGERPSGGDPAVVAHLAEVALAQPEQDRAVELRVAADEVLLMRMELLAVLVQPVLGVA